MSFDAYEKSPHSGSPVELYLVQYGAGTNDVIRMTNADNPVLVGLETFQPVYIERKELEWTGDPTDERPVEIIVAEDNPLVELINSTDFYQPVSVKIMALHLGDAAKQTTALFVGKYSSISREYPKVTIQLERISTAVSRPGCSVRVQRLCAHALYSTNCGVVKADYTTAATVTAVSGAVVTLSSAPAGLTGGLLSRAGVSRWVLKQTGNQLVLSKPIIGLAVGDDVTVSVGCDRNAATCRDKFNNLPNYLGFNFIPPKGPFEGGSLI